MEKTYKQKVEEYLIEQRKKGLIDVDFFWNHDAVKANVAEFGEEKAKELLYEEIWRAITAPDVSDPEVLGSRSPLPQGF